jgi:hypothetical protein
VPPKINPLAFAGIRFGRECAWYYWLGLAAWVAAVFCAVYAEYNLRVPNPPGGYLVEAFAAFLAPFIALMLADNTALKIYSQVALDLHDRNWAPQLIDSSSVDLIRQELKRHVLLRFIVPPVSHGLREQLLTAALWYPAVVLPPSQPWRKRYGEWLADVLGGYLLALCSWSVVYIWNDLRALPIAMLLTGAALAVLGYSSIRLAARRQAILDFFNAWLGA